MDKIEIPIKWHIAETNTGYIVAKSKDEYYHFDDLKDALSFIANIAKNHTRLADHIDKFEEDE